MTSSPRSGDRAKGVISGTIIQGDRGLYLNPDKVAVDKRDNTRISTPVFLDNLDSVEVITPAESWQAGDVVRNADDPDDARAWDHCRESPEDRLPWRLLGTDVWVSREELPTNLRKIMDGPTGRPVLPEPTDEDLNAADLAYTGADAAGEDEYAEMRAVARVLDERRGVRRPRTPPPRPKPRAKSRPWR